MSTATEIERQGACSRRAALRRSSTTRRPRTRRAAAVLIVVSLLAFLPGFFQIPPVDRDEARFAQATKQMIETGEYVDIRFQDEVRYKKPVGIYWLQAAAVKARPSARHPAGAHHHLALPACRRCSAAIGAVLLTYWAALAFVVAARRAARRR